MSAGETIIVLANAMVVALACLVPTQPRGLLAAQLVGLGLAGSIGTAVIQLRSPSPRQPGVPRGQRPTLTQLATLPFAVAGLSLAAQGGGGLYWMAGGIAIALAVGVLNGWVLLVEILR